RVEARAEGEQGRHGKLRGVPSGGRGWRPGIVAQEPARQKPTGLQTRLRGSDVRRLLARGTTTGRQTVENPSLRSHIFAAIVSAAQAPGRAPDWATFTNADEQQEKARLDCSTRAFSPSPHVLAPVRRTG